MHSACLDIYMIASLFAIKIIEIWAGRHIMAIFICGSGLLNQDVLHAYSVKTFFEAISDGIMPPEDVCTPLTAESMQTKRIYCGTTGAKTISMTTCAMTCCVGLMDFIMHSESAGYTEFIIRKVVVRFTREL